MQFQRQNIVQLFQNKNVDFRLHFLRLRRAIDSHGRKKYNETEMNPESLVINKFKSALKKQRSGFLF